MITKRELKRIKSIIKQNPRSWFYAEEVEPLLTAIEELTEALVCVAAPTSKLKQKVSVDQDVARAALAEVYGDDK